MLITKKGKLTLLAFLVAFICCGFLHVLFYYDNSGPQVFWANHFSQTYCVVFLVIWVLSIRWRITDDRQRSLLISMAMVMLLLCTLQVAKYRMYSGLMIYSRYLWYCYYIPTTLIPVIFFCVTHAVHRAKDEPLPKVAHLSVAIAVILIVLFLTNDLHQLAFNFPKGYVDVDSYSHGPVFYFYYVFFVVLFLASFLILLKKTGHICRMPARILPFIPAMILLVLTTLEIIGNYPKLSGIRLWNIGEVYVFTICGFVEACIQIGMIPSNSAYEELFKKLPISASIEDVNSNVVYSSAKNTSSGKDCVYRDSKYKIHGGFVQWKTDITDLVRIENELSLVNDQLRSRREYLKQQGDLLKEQTIIDAQNELYDRINSATYTTLNKIKELVEKKPTDENLTRVALLLTFVKRRSNMELTAEDGKLTAEELSAAFYETLKSIEHGGVSTALNSTGRGAYAQSLVIQTYEFVVSVLEDSLETLESVVIALSTAEDSMTVRLMLKGKRLSFERISSLPEVENFTSKVAITKNDDDIIITLVSGKWGEA